MTDNAKVSPKLSYLFGIGVGMLVGVTAATIIDDPILLTAALAATLVVATGLEGTRLAVVDHE